MWGTLYTMINWDNVFELLTIILGAWAVIALIAALLICRFIKVGRGPAEETSDRG